MNAIKVIEKPKSVSYNIIHDVLYKAHEANRVENKFTIKTAQMSGEELEEHVGPEGKCYIALDGEKVVGTLSNRVTKVKHWCAEGEVIELAMIGVLPEYRGMHIFPMLYDEAFKDVQNRKIKYIEIRTADKNLTMQRLGEHNGFKCIDFNTVGKDHYTVVMLKWLDKCPYPDVFIKLRYLIKKFYVKIRYKPGRVKRFGI